jgi:hypothetical protein
MPRWPQSTEERFWSHVEVGTPDACWPWTAAVTVFGYGKLRVDGVLIGAHVYSFTLHGGRPAPGFYVCHKCDDPACVNPGHLFLGSPGANVADMDRKGRRRNRVSAGVANPSAKLSEADVLMVRRRLAAGDRQAAIAKDFGVCLRSIQNICTGRTWASLITRRAA